MIQPNRSKFRRIIGSIFMLMGGGKGVAFTLVCTVIGGLFIGIASNELESLRASLHWPHVSGEVITSEVAENISVSRDKNGRETSTQVSYSSNVVYRYKVKGKEYTGGRVDFKVEMGREEAGNTVVKYPVGKYVRVYYAPESPANAVLVPGGDELLYRVAYQIGLIVLLIGWLTFPLIMSLMILVALVRNFPQLYQANREYFNAKIRFILNNFVSKKTVLAVGAYINARQERLRTEKALKGSRSSAGQRKKSFWDGFTLKHAIGTAILIPFGSISLILWMSIGFHVLFSGIEGVLNSDHEGNWPSANGLVMKSEMKSLMVTISDRTTSTARRYDLTVVVDYRVLGKHYTLNKQDFHRFYDPQAAREALKAFPKGNYVKVYYNPSAPEQGSLYPRDRPGVLVLGMGIFMVGFPIFIGGFLLWLLYRRLRGSSGEEAPP